MSDDDPRELRDDLAGGDDGDHGGDSRVSAWQQRQRLLRWVALVALLGMLLPTGLGTYSTARTTAEKSCRMAVDFYASERTPSRVAFELRAPDAVGFTCYAQLSNGDVLVAVLGLIPGPPRLVTRTLS
jgi:hypothetical protein